MILYAHIDTLLHVRVCENTYGCFPFRDDQLELTKPELRGVRSSWTWVSNLALGQRGTVQKVGTEPSSLGLLTTVRPLE